MGTSLASDEPKLGLYLCPEKNGQVRIFERDRRCTRGSGQLVRVSSGQLVRVSTHLWPKAQVISLSPPARQMPLGAGLSVECQLMGEVDVYGPVWVTCVLVCLAKVFKNEEFKIPWQWHSRLGLGRSLPSISAAFLSTCPNPHPSLLSPGSQACPPLLCQEPSLCSSRRQRPGLAQGCSSSAGPSEAGRVNDELCSLSAARSLFASPPTLALSRLSLKRYRPRKALYNLLSKHLSSVLGSQNLRKWKRRFAGVEFGEHVVAMVAMAGWNPKFKPSFPM